MNILRGSIALTQEDALHIGGHDQKVEELKKQIGVLEEVNRRLRAAINNLLEERDRMKPLLQYAREAGIKEK